MMLTAAFLCTVMSVYDGDTLTCADRTRVRLAAIDAPEIRGCRGRRGRVCVKGDARASQRNLEKITAGRTLRCEKTGTSYNRVVALCKTPSGIDLSCAQVRAGYAVRDVRYDRAGRLCR